MDLLSENGEKLQQRVSHLIDCVAINLRYVFMSLLCYHCKIIYTMTYNLFNTGNSFSWQPLLFLMGLIVLVILLCLLGYASGILTMKSQL